MPAPNQPSLGGSGVHDGNLDPTVGLSSGSTDADSSMFGGSGDEDDSGVESGDSWMAEVEMERTKNRLVKKGVISEYEAEKMATMARNKEAQEQLRQEWMALGHDFEKPKPKPRPRAKKAKSTLPKRRSQRNQGYSDLIFVYISCANISLGFQMGNQRVYHLQLLTKVSRFPLSRHRQVYLQYQMPQHPPLSSLKLACHLHWLPARMSQILHLRWICRPGCHILVENCEPSKALQAG